MRPDIGQAVIDELEALDIPAVQIDGFCSALVGYAWDGTKARLVYDYDACLQVLMASMPHADAQDHFDFNVMGTLPSMQIGACEPPLILHTPHH